MTTRQLQHCNRPAGRPRDSRWLLLVLPALLMMAALPASGREKVRRVDSYRGYSMRGALVETEVLVEGRRAPLYAAPDAGERRYFEASRGDDYALRIRNRTGRRVAILVVVDGLNAVNGERSSFSRHEPMYVLDPWESATIRGWRTSLQDVRQFVFVDEDRSYATRSGQANGDMGWIRVLAFEERRPVALRRDRRLGTNERPRGQGEPLAEAAPPPTASQKSDAGRSTPAAPEALHDRDEAEGFPGTGWGRRRHDPVRETWFDPAPHATDHLVLRYEYESGLQALGIFPDHDRLGERERGECRFALPPTR